MAINWSSTETKLSVAGALITPLVGIWIYLGFPTLVLSHHLQAKLEEIDKGYQKEFNTQRQMAQSTRSILLDLKAQGTKQETRRLESERATRAIQLKDPTQTEASREIIQNEARRVEELIKSNEEELKDLAEQKRKLQSAPQQ